MPTECSMPWNKDFSELTGAWQQPGSKGEVKNRKTAVKNLCFNRFLRWAISTCLESLPLIAELTCCHNSPQMVQYPDQLSPWFLFPVSTRSKLIVWTLCATAGSSVNDRDQFSWLKRVAFDCGLGVHLLLSHVFNKGFALTLEVKNPNLKRQILFSNRKRLIPL